MDNEIVVNGIRGMPVFFRMARVEAKPVRTGNLELVPRALELELGTRGENKNVLALARPLSVEVRKDGHSRVIPVRDTTRVIQLAMIAGAAGLFLRLARAIVR